MINPYLLSAEDMEKIRGSYDRADKEVQSEETRKMSLLHPYQTTQQVFAALQQDNASVDSVLSKMSLTLRKDSEVMLNLINKTERAYLYIHQDLNTLDFKQQALRQNPSVYNFLSDQDRFNPDISKAYFDGMLQHCTEKRKIDATTEAIQWKQQFSSKTNLDQVFSDQQYQESYRSIIMRGPYSETEKLFGHKILGEQFLFVSTARLLQPEYKERYDQLERQVWNQNPQFVANLAYNNRSWAEADRMLTAVETRCPEYQPLIAEKQKQYWEHRKDELLELQEKQMQGESLQQRECILLQEGLKHVKIESERKVSERVQKEREEELAYLKQDSIDRVYSAAANGDIEFGDAANVAAFIGNAPNKASSGVVRTQLESIEGVENDIDNVDIDREEDLKVSAYDLDGDGDYDQDDRDCWNNLAERTEDEIYEQEYAGNPFVSYVPESGMEHKFSYK